ncbi:MAG: GGDEF domain-containing protein [Devosia sp.]
MLLWTVLGTLGCVAVALLVDSINFPNLTPEELQRAILIDVLVPIALAGPLLFLLLDKLRRVGLAHDRYAQQVGTDELTGLLSRATFLQEIEETLLDGRFAEGGMRGTLLIVDADDFKSVNDAHGHDAGDAALQLIARAIRSVLRSADRVGRVGGEEFGIFLPSTSPLVGEAVAERIRVAVSKLDFAPGGQRVALSVTVGGAAYDRYLPFVELFRLADQQLYAAKRNGRNRSSVSPIKHYETLPAAAA